MEPTREDHGERHQRLEQLFLSALPHVDQAVRFVAHRHRLSAAEAEDFASEVKLAFINEDYAVLDRFEGRSSLRTYLVTVIQRLYIDHVRKHCGRWRPSTQARRLGTLAVRLEALLHRDNLSVSEACETLRTNDRVAESEAALRELAQKLPFRESRGTHPLDEDDSAALRAPSPAEPDGRLARKETAERCQRALETALRDLSAEDRVLIRLRYEDGLAAVDIARGLGYNQRALYTRIERLLAGLREVLVRHELSWPEVKVLIDEGSCHVRLPAESSEEKGRSRPSQLEARS